MPQIQVPKKSHVTTLRDTVNALNLLVTGTTPDANSVVTTIQEILAILSDYPEGVSVLQALNGKVSTSAIINALDHTAGGGVLDARQGKVLLDMINALGLNQDWFDLEYATTISEPYSPSNPNLSVGPLLGNLNLSLTGTSAGNSGILLIQRGSGGNETITLNGTVRVSNFPTGAGAIISLTYLHELTGLAWYCNNPVQPMGAIADDSIPETKLAPEVRTKLNAVGGGGGAASEVPVFALDLGDITDPEPDFALDLGIIS